MVAQYSLGTHDCPSLPYDLAKMSQYFGSRLAVDIIISLEEITIPVFLRNFSSD